ncbi:CAP domain-containing protein, partial [Paenibacillus kobensis]|uniref:CAP domain-containing protein n=1 Tax=Paenibacillus kobensis TaxID=59841 RepID=UPI001FEA468E
GTSAFAQQVVTLVNQERAKAGLSALSSDSLLTKVAAAKAKDMYDNNYFDHTSPTYGSPFDMMRSFGVSYSYAGENIAKGQKSPQEVMNAWMNSAGHKANIMSANYKKIGVAYYNGEWVQEFTG